MVWPDIDLAEVWHNSPTLRSHFHSCRSRIFESIIPSGINAARMSNLGSSSHDSMIDAKKQRVSAVKTWSNLIFMLWTCSDHLTPQGDDPQVTRKNFPEKNLPCLCQWTIFWVLYDLYFEETTLKLRLAARAWLTMAEFSLVSGLAR